jgi:hypothetical protein
LKSKKLQNYISLNSKHNKYHIDMPITTKVVSSNPAHGEVYSMQKYVIKFASDLRQFGCVLRVPPPLKLTATIYLKYC